MFNWLMNLFLGRDVKKDLRELDNWREVHSEYRRWLNEFPIIAIVLDHMKVIAKGNYSLDACHPPSIAGPWDVSGLRHHLRNIREGVTQAYILPGDENEFWICVDNKDLDETTKLKNEIKQLREKLAEASQQVVEKNREVNKLRFVCGEAYVQLGRYRVPNQKALENLYAASKGVPLPHDSFTKPESLTSI